MGKQQASKRSRKLRKQSGKNKLLKKITHSSHISQKESIKNYSQKGIE